MIKTLAELAGMVGGELRGDGTTEVRGVADLQSAQGGDITFLSHEKKRDLLIKSKAAAAVVPLSSTSVFLLPVIAVKDPYLAIAKIHTLFLEHPFLATGVDQKAVVGNDCHIPAVTSVGPMAVIGNRVTLGERVTLGPGVVVGDDVVIGDDTILKPNVTVGDGTVIGSRVTIHAGSVIGSDGFGYATDHLGHHFKRPQVGIVQIDDDVEIGSNVCIDRATFGKTWVKRGAKIDNLVQVAHNVVVGEDSILISQVGISGSSVLGTGVVLGGQAGVAGHVRIGDRVMAAARSGIHADIPEKSVVSGFPAISHTLWLRIASLMTKLPDLVRDVRSLKKQVADLIEK